ncbi:MAG: hypothetical protein KF696_07400 [Planctomycetes bacterium]|nr:hypothetical protein [Planctomycetota bacterium]MCW8135376.1 hypothetical protein [Planctomycetota bacterium]
MRILTVCALALMLAACGGGGKQKSSDLRDPDTDFTVKPRNDEGGNKSSSGKSNKSGSDGGANKAANGGDSGSGDTGKPQPDPEPVIDKPLARTDIEGKVTEFHHVVALWDEVNHAVRFVASTKAIPADQLERLRIGEPLEGETPHFMLSFVLEEGTTTMNKAKVENWFYDFHWLTSLSPMSLRNIGKESISVMNGKAKVGETLKLVIDFKSEKVKDAPAEKIHFDVQFEIKLQ